MTIGCRCDDQKKLGAEGVRWKMREVCHVLVSALGAKIDNVINVISIFIYNS